MSGGERESVTLEEQIACIERAIRTNETFSPAWIAAGKVTESEAAAEWAALMAVRESLKLLCRRPICPQGLPMPVRMGP